MAPKTIFRILLVPMAILFLGYGQAQAAAINLNGNAFLVPYVTFDSSTATTVVGIVPATSGTIYWKFFDQDGGQIQTGTLGATANQVIGFNWSAVANASLAGTKGYLLFTIDTNGDGLITNADSNAFNANAFFVDIASSDVLFIPTVLLDDGGLDGSDPAAFNIASLPYATDYHGVPPGRGLEVRYYVDGAPGGEDSLIVLWTSADPGPSQSVTMYDNVGNSKDIALSLPRNRLNLIDPEALSERPASYLDGYIRWTPVPSGQTAYGFTLVDTTAFGAIQTLVGVWF